MASRILILCWLLTSLVSVLYIHRLHLTPVAQAQVPDAANAQREMLALAHYIAPRCGCSQILVDYFIQRGVSEFAERMVIVEDSPTVAGKKLAERLRKVGFAVQTRKIGELEGLPLFEVVDAQGSLLYRGGYTKGPISPFVRIEDLDQARRIGSGGKPKGYFAYGCAVAKQLIQSLDPLGVKSL